MSGHNFSCWCPACGGTHIARFAERPTGELIELCPWCRVQGFEMGVNGDLYREVRAHEKTRDQMIEEYRRAMGCVGGVRAQEEKE